MDRKRFGNYATLSIKKDECLESKINKIAESIKPVLDSIVKVAVPDFDTMEIIIHEPSPDEMTVGVKYMSERYSLPADE